MVRLLTWMARPGDAANTWEVRYENGVCFCAAGVRRHGLTVLCLRCGIRGAPAVKREA